MAMVRRRYLSALALLLACGSAWAQQQQSAEVQTREAILHAIAYLKANGRSAEAACFMRRAQRFDFDPRSVIKDYYKARGLDDVRFVLIRIINLWALGNEDVKLNAIVGLTDAVVPSLKKQAWPAAIDDAKRLAEAIKAVRGDKDLVYATALNIVADLQSFNHDYAAVAATLEQVLAIRQSARPSADAKVADPRSASVAKIDLARTMSKLADTYWILGQDQRAAKLRSDPQARAGDAFRIADIDSVDAKVPDRTPLDPDFPSCVATIFSR
jgi:hypothetical protein